jgi:ribonuclease P protein component
MLQILKSEKDFAHGRFKKSVATGSIRIRAAWPGQNNPRFGFIIPKKTINHATDRNKVRRRLKSIIVKNLGSIVPSDILIFPQKISLQKSFEDLEKDFISALMRLRLWKS